MQNYNRIAHNTSIINTMNIHTKILAGIKQGFYE